MNKRCFILFTIICLACLTLFITGCTSDSQTAPVPDESNQPTDDDNAQNNTSNTVNIYLIGLEDEGENGKPIGTGDSLVSVEKTIDTEETPPIRAALNELLAIDEEVYGVYGFYNPLQQSDLKVDEVKVQNSKAVIHLSGELLLGGVMDNPRVEVQLKETALQFPTIEEVEIYINDIKLEELLSGKGM